MSDISVHRSESTSSDALVSSETEKKVITEEETHLTPVQTEKSVESPDHPQVGVSLNFTKYVLHKGLVYYNCIVNNILQDRELNISSMQTVSEIITRLQFYNVQCIFKKRNIFNCIWQNIVYVINIYFLVPDQMIQLFQFPV